MPHDPPQPGRLKRELGLPHAVLLGLGSILGTGVFVSIGIAAGIAGPSVLIAIVLAALLALCNGLSSAQLAAAHPVAGGTYEYGYRFLHPKLGFTAGWMFLLAKSASAATAALGVFGFMDASYFFHPISRAVTFDFKPISSAVPLALMIIIAITALVLLGLRRSTIVNSVLVGFTVLGLGLACVLIFNDQGFTRPSELTRNDDFTFMKNGTAGLLASTALLFVAYTGYGRIATLGEEVRNPRRTIPIAIPTTLCICVLLYLAVGQSLLLTGVSRVMAEGDGKPGVLLWAIPLAGDHPYKLVVALTAITAMLGVLLNLVLGLSRVLLAMGRRHDVPGFFKNVNASGTTPVPAVIGVGILIAGLTLIGDVKTTWTFSAFTVLIYYGITNLAALRLPKESRLYPRFFSYAGLGGCLFLCWWVEPIVWLIGLKLIVFGLLWHTVAPRLFGDPPAPTERCAACGYDLRASADACPECGQAIPQAEPD